MEVVRGADGRATGLKIAKCEAKFVGPKLEVKVDEASAQVVPADLIVSAIGQAVDFTGLDGFDNGRGLISADKNYQVAGKPGIWAGGDVLRPHLLTTAIGHGWIAAEGIDRFLRGEAQDKRPKIDVHSFDLMRKLVEKGIKVEEAPREPFSLGVEASTANRIFTKPYTATMGPIPLLHGMRPPEWQPKQQEYD